jgi:hypothetical protein
MAYAEGLFVFALLSLLYGMARRWPLLWLAIITGFITAVRPVGIAASAAFMVHVLVGPGKRGYQKAAVALLLFPISCWGLLGYMGYQAIMFENPLAFAQTQEHLTMMMPGHGLATKLRSLLALEPVWGLYIPGYPRYWANADPYGHVFFSILFWNPVCFILAAALLLLGGLKHTLTIGELVLGIGLLGIPYVTRSYEMSMASHARFSAVVVVDYLVVGRVLARYPAIAACAIYPGCSVLLFAWSALFGAGYLVN